MPTRAATVPIAQHLATVAAIRPSGTWSGGSALDAVVASVVRATNNITALAEQTGIPRRRLYEYGTLADNPSDQHRKLPAEAIVPLTLATGRGDIVQHLCDATGYVAVRRQAVRTSGDPLTLAASVTAEFSDFQRAIGALIDGAAAREIETTIRELGELIVRAESMRVALIEKLRRPGAKAAGK